MAPFADRIVWKTAERGSAEPVSYSELAVGGARLKVVKRIVRCAATNVDPQTGARDMEIPPTLMRTVNHMDCGVYAEVVGAGDIAVGNNMR